MWCSRVLPSVKLRALHESVVPAGVTVMLGLCNPPHRGCSELIKPGLKSRVYPVMWIPYCGTFRLGLQSRVVYVIGDLESYVRCCDR
jgi:hypothetical protein